MGEEKVWKVKIETKKVTYGLILICLFLSAMNFWAKFFYFSYAAALILFAFGGKILLNSASVLYLILAFLMGIYNVNNGFLAAMRCFSYVLMYLVGYGMTVGAAASKALSDNTYGNRIKKGQECAYAVLATIATGSFSHYMLNYLFNMGQTTGRNTNDIWSQEVMSATGQTLLGCIMAGFSVALVLLPPKKMSRYIGGGCILCLLSYNLVLAGRTLIAILSIVFIIGVLFLLRNAEMPAQSLRFIGVSLCFLIIFIIIYSNNIGNIQDTIVGSNFYARFHGSESDELLASGRWENRIKFIRNAYLYPFGGLHMRKQIGYAHDLLLDAYDEYGFLTTVFLIAILWNGIKELHKFCQDNRYRVYYRISFLCVYIAILLAFCVEPIFAGMPWLFVCYSLINGCVAGMNQNKTCLLSGEIE